MISIECFKGLPIEYEYFLINKYDSFITTCRYIEVNYPTHDVNYMIVYEDANLVELLVYGNNGNTSRCFNSLTNIDQNIITEFIKKIFEEHPSIQKVNIDASYKEYTIKKAILYSKSNDLILNLPPTIEDYYKELGSSTRQHLRSRKSKLLKDYPNINFITKYGTEIEEGIVDKIIQLNRDRMKHKGVIPGIDSEEKNNIYKYSQYYGCVVYLEIDGVIVAGCISTMLNKGISIHVFAHDNSFSKYNLGEVCVSYLIQTSIEKGMSIFHFLWGESELKKRMLAKPHLLYSYFVYRTYSFDYFLYKSKSIFSDALTSFQHSDFSKPLRNIVKSYRKMNWKT